MLRRSRKSKKSVTSISIRTPDCESQNVQKTLTKDSTRTRTKRFKKSYKLTKVYKTKEVFFLERSKTGEKVQQTKYPISI